MSESFAPPIPSITPQQINRLRVVESDTNWDWLDIEMDVGFQPTQVFRDCVQTVLINRNTQKLTEQLDDYLSIRKITH